MGGLISTHGSAMVKEQKLDGKVAIVTGPTTGIGYETAAMMASVGCHVILAGRGQSRLEKLAITLTQQLAKIHPNITPQFTAIELDLTSFVSIHTFFVRFRDLHLPCHYLFNNAGVMMTDYSKTVDGFELQLGTNCVGHQYLTNLLMPILIASAPARIIHTSSLAHNFSNYDIKNGEEEIKKGLFPTEKQYNRTKWYGHSKLGNIYQAREMTHRYGSQGVISLACHPGVVATELGRTTWYNKIFYKGFGWTMKNSNQGAATQLWAALDPEWEKHINEPEFSFYSKDCHIAKTSKLGKQKEFGKMWYDYNEREIARVATSLGLPITGDTTVVTPIATKREEEQKEQTIETPDNINAVAVVA